MANPQAENGHVDIANEIVDALCRTHITSSQFRVLFCIIRKTYGWRKKEDKISYSQIAEITDIKDIRNVGRTLVELKERNLISIRKNGHGNYYSFQKNYEIWDKPLSILTTSEMTTSEMTTSEMTPAIVNPDNSTIVNPDNTPLSIQTNTKDNYTKDNVKTTTNKRQGGNVVVVGLDFLSLYEKNFGIPLPTNKENLIALGDKYGAQIMFDSVLEAIKKENKGLKYIEGIAKNKAMDAEWEGSKT